jgi:uncharacterized membrane protein
MNNQLVPTLLVLLSSFLGASAQYMYKKGANQLHLIPWYKNYPIFGGMILFTLVMFLFIGAFRMGGKLSVVYPAYATTFIWATLLGYYFDNETISLGMVIGMFLIVIGVIVINVKA